ncbi:flagellar hook-associated protein 2 [Rhodovulum bhavnagarense]|uniref:Flagellar hook-associated protein 2 n=1 Tax=Rhodovulum bhavnagarense TaxID=992286 RepID=A0A4R2RD82_9RHOB|nr:flagellar filament capping protein FliD [Rhodovulum bhavnagarense]TCP61400.1 flagellar hook-associated protein 2 [Rhodovulum bhavnagarense]
MVQDILSSLNTSGSGINLAEMATDLVEAEIAPRRAIIDARIETSEATISELGELRAQLGALGTALDGLSGLSALTFTGSIEGISAEVSDLSRARAGAHTLEVQALAKAQVLDIAGFMSADENIAEGTLTLDFGAWDDTSFTADPARASVVIAVTAGTTLAQLAEQIDAVPGVNAGLVDVGNGTLSLSIVSQTGAGNALRLSASPDPAGTGTDLARFDTSADNAQQVQAASDALVTYNGIAVSRPSNEIDNLISGVTLFLDAVTPGPQTLELDHDIEAAFFTLEGFIDQVNTLKSYLSDVTARGIADTDVGALAAEQSADQVKTFLDGLTSRALAGFASGEIRLSEMGVATGRDGMLTLNRDAFDAAFARDPSRFDALLGDRLASSAPDISLALSATADAVPGLYRFERDPATGVATLDGIALAGSPSGDGGTRYTVTSGPMQGLSLTVGADVIQAEIGYGRSLVSLMAEDLDAILSADGVIARRQSALENGILNDQSGLSDLEDRATTLEARYLKQFTAMEQIVSEMNSTAEYLDNLVAAWNADS